MKIKYKCPLRVYLVLSVFHYSMPMASYGGSLFETSYLYLGQQWCRIISKSIDFTRFESCLLQRFPGSFTVKVEEVAEALFSVIKWIFRPNSSKIWEDEYKIRNTFFSPAKSVLIVKIIFWIRQKMNLKLNFLNIT